jgi:hypothetical protein
MPFAAEMQGISGVHQLFSPGPHAILQTSAQGLVVADIVPDTMPGWVQAGKKSSTRGAAVGGRAVGFSKSDPLLGKAVQMGRFGGMAWKEGIPALVVRHYDQDIGRRHYSLRKSFWLGLTSD